MEKVAGPNRAVLQAVQHWPYYPAGLWAPHCALAEGLDNAQGGDGLRGFCAGISPSRLWSVGIKDTATGAIAMTVSYQRP